MLDSILLVAHCYTGGAGCNPAATQQDTSAALTIVPLGVSVYAAIRADMRLLRDGREIAVLHPERRNFSNGTATHVAIRTNLLADVYAVIGEADVTGAYVLRLYYNPLVPWVWLGAVVMAFGGLVSLSDRRHRIGAPARRTGTVAVAAPAQAAE